MEKELVATTKELFGMLYDLIRRAQSDEFNPFEESKLVLYANDGITKLKQLNVADDTLVRMYDIDDVLYFEVK